MTDFPSGVEIWSARVLGALAGASISLAYLLPRNRQDAALRFLTGVASGLMFGGPTGLWIAGKLDLTAGGKYADALTNFETYLTLSQTFEDLGVAAYNGAGQLIKNVDYLAAAGSIVSIEARHAAAIADLIKPFSAEAAGRGNVDHKGLDGALLPSAVLKAAGPFIKTPVTAATLP